MKIVKFHGIPLGVCLLGALVGLCLLAAAAAVLQCAAVGVWTPIEQLALIICFAVLFLLPGVGLLVWCVLEYRTVVTVSEDGVSLYRGKRLRKVFLWADIRIYGLAAFRMRENRLFFCTKQIDERYLEHNEQAARLIFGKQYDALAGTQEGRLRLAVGTALYERCTSREADLIVFQYGSPARLAQIAEFTDIAPVLTGPCMMREADS